MTIDIKVPSMGESVSEAVISAILKPTGSFVRADEDVIELETDKVNQVLYAPAEGKLSWKVAVGDRVAIGQILGQVDTTSSPSALEPKELPVVKPVVAGGSARKMAESFVQEIKHVPEKQEVPIPKVETEMSSKYTRKSMSNLRKVLSKRLVEAKNTTAMLTTFNEIDMSTILEIRMREKERFQEKYGARLGFMSFFVKGVVSALQAIPQVNAYIDGEDIVTMHTYDIGVAVSTDRGLVVPVIRGCEALGFGGIEKAIATFAEKAKKGGLSVDDLRGGSFTITNGGVFGSLLSTPILNPPQSAILGMHAIVKRPVVVEDEIVIRPMMYVALSYDHRIVDGKEAVLFLVHLKQMLEDPAKLLLESN